MKYDSFKLNLTKLTLVKKKKVVSLAILVSSFFHCSD